MVGVNAAESRELRHGQRRAVSQRLPPKGGGHHEAQPIRQTLRVQPGQVDAPGEPAIQRRRVLAVILTQRRVQQRQ